MNSTKDVLDRYIGSFRVGDLEGILKCYTQDAVLFSPHGVSRGQEAIRAFFRSVCAPIGVLGTSFKVEQQSIEGDSGYVRWSAEKANNLSQVGCDRFTFEGGTIVAHSFAARIRMSADLRRETAMAREQVRLLYPGRAASDLETYAYAMVCTCSDFELLASHLALHHA